MAAGGCLAERRLPLDFQPLAFALYRSETDMPPDSDEAFALMVGARRFNAEHGVTGFLHHEDGFFFQWYEGSPEAAALIAARIEADQRHRDVTYLWRGTQDQRQFDRWSMGYSTRNDSSIMTWLADHAVSKSERRAYGNAVLSFLQQRRHQAS